MGNAAELQSDYLESLNPAQRQAATWGKTSSERSFEAPPLLVIAGAGTGKTMTLAHRVAPLPTYQQRTTHGPLPVRDSCA